MEMSRVLFLEEDRQRERFRMGYFVNNGFEWYIDDNTSLLGSFFYNDYSSDNLESNTIRELDGNWNILNTIIQNEIEDDVNREYNLNLKKFR